MKFDKLYEELEKQLELHFSIRKPVTEKPKWAVACGNLCDDVLKKYYPIKNMQNGKRKSVAFKKFWMNVVKILKGKGLTSIQMQDLNIPEYILNIYR
jgi:hypothetical protein